MSKHEDKLKAALMRVIRAELRPPWVSFRHEDVLTSGVPDISNTGNGFTSWLEVKHATPDFKSPGQQELTMMRLATSGFARYVVYYEDKNNEFKRTLIVHPRNISSLSEGNDLLRWVEDYERGHSHMFVVNYLKVVHKVIAH